ncbi:MAG: hypothetical protein ACRCYY_06220 [Trueperaceae bacterium]
MVLALTLSSVLSGLVATAVMIVFLYLPLSWGGVYYDTLGAIGAVFLKRIDGQARLFGGVVLLLGGILFAFFYGAFVLMFTYGSFAAPSYAVFPNWPVQFNLFYPLLGLVGGLGQGIYVTLISTFIITDFHPVTSYREAYPLILSFMIGHMVYGVVVMFFQHQLLQLLLA